jgi:hypothetical protein
LELEKDATTTSLKSIGRPKGSMKQAKKEKDQAFKDAMMEIIMEYAHMMRCFQERGRIAPRGSFKQLRITYKEKFNITPGLIKYKTIVSRILTGNFSGKQWQKISPISELEPVIASFCREMAIIGQPLDKKQPWH